MLDKSMKILPFILLLCFGTQLWACELQSDEVDAEVRAKLMQELSVPAEAILSSSVLYLLRFVSNDPLKCPESFMLFHGSYVKIQDEVCAVSSKIVVDYDAGPEHPFTVLDVVCE